MKIEGWLGRIVGDGEVHLPILLLSATYSQLHLCGHVLHRIGMLDDSWSGTQYRRGIYVVHS